MSKTNNSRRIGPRMIAAVAYVRNHPGCPKLGPARHVAPKRLGRVGLGYGYRTVDRAIEAGLIMATRVNASRYALSVVEMAQ